MVSGNLVLVSLTFNFKSTWSINLVSLLLILNALTKGTEHISLLGMLWEWFQKWRKFYWISVLQQNVNNNCFP